MTRIIGVVSGKGGVGKTTTVANLGTALASRFGRKVIAIDCNFTTSHLALHLDMYYTPITINHLMRGSSKLEDSLYEHESGMMVLPASISFKDLYGLDFMKLKRIVGQMVGDADFILLDSAPGLGREAMATLKASGELLFITAPQAPSVMDLMRLKEVAGDSKVTGVVLSMCTGDSHEFRAAEIERISEMSVIAQIPFDKNVPRSIARRVPVVTYRPHSPAARAYFALAAKLCNERYEGHHVVGRILSWISDLMG